VSFVLEHVQRPSVAAVRAHILSWLHHSIPLPQATMPHMCLQMHQTKHCGQSHFHRHGEIL
jgi:hypothetical protein